MPPYVWPKSEKERNKTRSQKYLGLPGSLYLPQAPTHPYMKVPDEDASSIGRPLNKASTPGTDESPTKV